MKREYGKYVLSEACDWCKATSGLREIKIQTNGVKAKRYFITATACGPCADRLMSNDDD